MIINTKAHPTKDVYKKQFEELLNVSKMSYGIVSDVNPNTKNSPLWCDTLSLQSILSLNDFPSYYETLELSFNPSIQIVSNTENNIYLGFRDTGKENFFKFDFIYNEVENTKEIKCTGAQQAETLKYDIKSIEISSNTYPSFTRVNSVELLETGKFYCNNETGDLKLIGVENEKTTISYINYKGNVNDTIESMYSALMQAEEQGLGINVVNNSTFITINGIANEGIVSNSSYIKLKTLTRIYVKKGSAVMKNGNVVSVDKDTIIPFNYEDNNKTLYIVLTSDFNVSEYGKDEFEENRDKIISVVGNVYVTTDYIENDDSICLSVIKTFNYSINSIDSNKEKFYNVRPWYSPSDLKHELMLGTGKKTENNPHAIGFNDIDSENTLHNKLINRGVILSKPTERQDTCGELKSYYISRKEVKFDYDNSIFDSNSSEDSEKTVHYAYFSLPEIPISIVSIETKDGHLLPNYEWIEHTNLIKVNDNVIKDFEIKYYSESSLEPYLNNENTSIEVKNIRDNCLLFSEGKNVTEINNEITFDEVKGINKNYEVFINSKGDFIKVPSLEASSELEITDGELTSLFSRSRLEFILNTKNKDILDCPISVKGSGNSTEEVEIYQSFGLYTIDEYGSKILKYESMICPNPFIPNIAESGLNVLQIKCEKSNQKNIDFYEMSKTTFVIDSQTNCLTFYSRENKTIYGGLDIDLEFISELDSENDISIIIEHTNNNVTRSFSTTIKSNSCSISIHNDSFDNTKCYGTWRIRVTNIEEGQKLYFRNISIKVNYGKIEPILYSKFNESYVKLKAINEHDGIIEVNPFYGSEAYVNDNNDFKVSIDIVGTVNGENLTETIEFDSRFRNQQDLNSKVSNNVFDELFKYSISESSTSGKLNILAYPVGNINNMCGVVNCKYKNLKIAKISDSRKVSPNLMYEDKTSTKFVTSLAKNLYTFLNSEKQDSYFGFKNISKNNETVRNITLYSSNEFTAKVIDSYGDVQNSYSSIQENEYYKISISELPFEYSVFTYKQNVTNLQNIISIQDELDDYEIEVTNWDSNWTSLNNLCTEMKSLSKIPSSWEGCENVVDMKNAFSGSKLSAIPRIWKSLGKVTTMENCFYKCTKLKSIPSSFEGLNSVTTIKRCFSDCSNLEIDDISFKPLKRLIGNGIESAFENCYKINKVSSFEGLNNVISMYHTFANSKLKSIPDSWSFLENVTDTRNAFENCYLEYIPNSWNGLNKVSDVSYMFSGCNKILSIPDSWRGFESVAYMISTFYNCSSVTTGGSKDADTVVSIENYENAFDGMSSWTVNANDIEAIFQETIDKRG